MTLYQYVSRGCANDAERRARANALADRAKIHRGLMGRYLSGEVAVGPKNAQRIEKATQGEVTASDLVFGEAKEAS